MSKTNLFFFRHVYFQLCGKNISAIWGHQNIYEISIYSINYNTLNKVMEYYSLVYPIGIQWAFYKVLYCPAYSAYWALPLPWQL